MAQGVVGEVTCRGVNTQQPAYVDDPVSGYSLQISHERLQGVFHGRDEGPNATKRATNFDCCSDEGDDTIYLYELISMN